ncbi:Clavaminate synthase-like protein [Leucogyrophana mollusca]|uniref:Clavaminate synthase-like protein n=1 Tax=Leucogyrophana mollusca TaxID=85980 RepID=A0ACB8BVF1_9AGAM|nr:Clavaminate synthase-like protein [Leucogyrophana mollusca]
MNGSYIETLDTPPTAVEFSRLVHISRPVVIKGLKVPASARWTDDYLAEKMGERKISVALTPNGLADAVTRGSDGKLYFTEPCTDQMTMREFMSRLTADRGDETDATLYLQSQNGNLYSASFFEQDGRDISEFESLRADVPSNISWCGEAFGKAPDAVNLWIGDSRSTTSIHSDPYENIYTVVRGSKHFTLLPPTEGWCLQERTYPHATYTRSTSSSCLSLTPSPSDTPPVRWSSVASPHLPNTLPPEAHPLHVTLNAGDTLYLPVGWWHHVRQSGDITIALNWWYDAEVQGMSWVWLNVLRGVRDVPPGNVEEENCETTIKP